MVHKVSDQVGSFAEGEGGVVRGDIVENGIAGGTTGNSVGSLVASTYFVVGEGERGDGRLFLVLSSLHCQWQSQLQSECCRH